jgi:hypothetical protein
MTQAACLPTAPQGNTTQAGHSCVAEQQFGNATNTSGFGEAEQP